MNNENKKRETLQRKKSMKFFNLFALGVPSRSNSSVPDPSYANEGGGGDFAITKLHEERY